SASVKAKDLIQLKSRISAALNMRLRLGDHIVPKNLLGLKKLVDPNESFLWSLFAPRPETDPQHSAHSLRAREGYEVQFMRPRRSGAAATRSSLP
ncbi:hypothetical protein A2U01_0041837, partial [Trifolium medium]|nr:hypothetical protein [Trifolium medium]